MQKGESLKNYSNSTYSLNGVMEYLNEQIQLLTDKETSWQEEREQLQAKITQLERDLSQQRAINGELIKKMKHRRTSSEDKTIIFNQTNISSYFPPIVMMHRSAWTSKKNLRSHLDSVRALAWHNDFLVSSGQDCLMKFWREGELISTVRGTHQGYEEHLGPVFTMTKHKDQLFTGGSEGLVRQWDLAGLDKGRVTCKLQQELHSDVIWQLNHHKSMPVMLSSGADGLVQLARTDQQMSLQHRFLRKMNNGEQLYTPTSLDWLDADRFVTSYLELPEVVVFDIPTQKIIVNYTYKFEETYRQANKILFNEHNRLILSAHEDKMIRFLDPSSDKIVKSLVAHSDSVTGLTFQQKSYEFGSSSHDGSVRVWDMRNFRCLNDVPIPCKKYDQAANTLLQHPSDMIIAVGGADGIIRMLFESE